MAFQPGDKIAYGTREGVRTAYVLHVTRSGLLAIQRGDEIIYRRPKNAICIRSVDEV